MDHELVLLTRTIFDNDFLKTSEPCNYWRNITNYCANLARDEHKEHLGHVILNELLQKYRATYIPNKLFDDDTPSYILFLDLEGKTEFLLTWNY